MGEVRVLNVTRVSLSPLEGPCPEPVKLSFFDAKWIRFPPLQRLRESLSRTLSRYYALAGKFTAVDGTGDLMISFSGDGGDGVDFLWAEAEGIDFQRLTDMQRYDEAAFLSLVPVLEASQLPAPVGVVIGFSMHHMAADGKAIWQFVDAWAAECRISSGGGASSLPEPLHDRSVISHPRAEEIARSIVRTVAPNLPSLSDSLIKFYDPRKLSRRTFIVKVESIASLKDRGTATHRPSAFAALAAHIWLSIVRAKGIPPDDLICPLLFEADCRRRLDPPVEDRYFGNCVKPCLAGIKAACAAVRRAVQEATREPLSDIERWTTKSVLTGFPIERLANVSGSPRFRVYDADFGWGGPRRVEMVSMNGNGEVALLAARDEEGSVQLSVSISRLCMDAFASSFVDGLQA
ncbi:unnamed protein product [Spirodela intermedia]|uniref:Uncharacterized protein n=1 Tax=Spirodela intermedia TaxID=51605 RepID=A0A7I8J3Q7_SPIIN|nr:unnamed protein product [Spirodela intermedia]CAA6664888.1 unnamed protein product [Spirodela intermedia]